jgi:hypothetical protein
MIRRSYQNCLPIEVRDALDADATRMLWLADELARLPVVPSDHSCLVQLWRLCSSLSQLISSTGMRAGDAVHDKVVLALSPLVTSTELAEISPGTWCTVAETFQKITHAKHKRWERSALMLTWEPFKTFFNYFFRASGRQSDAPSRSFILKKLDLSFLVVGSRFFRPGSLAEMWSELSPDFAPESDEGVVSLAMLTMSCPLFDHDTQLLQTIFRFLFVESADWYYRSGSWSFCTWLLFKRLVTHSPPGFIDFDELAEPLFSSILFCLALQTGDDARQPLPVQGHVVEIIVAMTKDSDSSFEAKLHGSVAYALRNDTSSPLWNHLRRFLRATDVFLRPSAAPNCCIRLFKFLSSLVSSMLRRVHVQRKAGQAFVCNAGYELSQSTVDTFVRLLLPPFHLLAAHKSKSLSSEAQTVLCRLSSLAPLVVFELCAPQVLQRMSSTEPHNAVIAMESLGYITPEVSRAAPGELSKLLAVVFASAVEQIDMNHLPRTMFATRLVFQSCLNLNLGAICSEEDMLQFFHKIFILSDNMGASAKVSAGFFNAFRAIIRTLPQPTALGLLRVFVNKLKDQGDGSKLAAFGALLSSFAHVLPCEVLDAVVPTCRKILSSQNASKAEVKWFGSLLCYALTGGGREAHAHREAVETCITSLLERCTNRGRISMAGQILRRFAEALTVIRTDGNFADPTVWGSEPSECDYPPTFTADDVSIVWVTPCPEHADLVVDLLEREIAKACAILRDVDGEIARRGASDPIPAAAVISGAADTREFTEESGEDEHEDEPLTEHSLIRCTVGWLYSLVSIGLAFFPSPPDPLNTWWRTFLTPVKSFSTRRLSMTALDLHDLLVTNVLHKVVGNDSHVLRRSDSATSQLIRMDQVSEKYAQPNVKGVPTLLALLCLLCGADSCGDSAAFADGTAMFFDNWRRQLPSIRRMPRFFWCLSGEFSIWSRLHAGFAVSSARAFREVTSIAWQLSFHRYASVSSSAQRVLNKCSKILPIEDGPALIATHMAEMRHLSAVCDLPAAPDGGADTRRNRHEVVACFATLTQLAWWASVLGIRAEALEVLLQFTDDLHSTEEAARAACFACFVREYQALRPSTAEFQAVSTYLITQASKLAFHKPQRAAACLDAMVRCYHSSLRQPLPAALLQLVMRLAINNHLRLRSPSFTILAAHFLALKMPSQKQVTSLELVDGEYRGVFFERVPYYGLPNGLYFPPMRLLVRGERPMVSGDDPSAAAVLAGVDLSADGEGRFRSPWILSLLQFAIDNKSFSSSRAEFWKGILLVTGVKKLLPVLIDSVEQLVRSHAAAMRERLESQQGLFATIAEVFAGCFRATKHLSDVRPQATAFLLRVVELFLSPSAPHEVLSSLLRALTFLKNCTTAEELLMLYDRLLDMLEGSLREALSSQEDLRVLSFILQLIMGFSPDITSRVLPHVIDRICRLKSVFLYSTSSQSRNCAASVLRMCLHAYVHVSPLLRSHEALRLSIEHLTDVMFDAAAGAADDAAVHKSVMALWALPNPTALRDIMRFTKFSAAALDIKRSEIDDLLSMANGTWKSIAFSRLKKSVVMDTIAVLCDFLMESKYTSGHSSWAKTVFLRALRIVLYNNTHRIGKFAVIQSVADAAVKSLECPDHRVRLEAMLLLSVVTKVATEDQVQYIVLTLSKLVTAADAPYAPVAALCGILQADPDAVPPYVPRLLARMAPLARRGNSEVASVVKRMFLQWWKTHRDRWETEHQSLFTEAQKEMLEDLFKSPSYYV